MDEKGARRESSIAQIAARQHGVVTSRQLNRLGLTKNAIFNRVRTSRLHRVHRGVYAVGHPALSQEGRWVAAVLACGQRAVLSHRSAAALWGLLPAPPGPVDITVAGGGTRRRRQGIRRHRSDSLNASHITRHYAISVTTPARTIADLRPVSTPAQYRRAVREAAVLGLKTGNEKTPDPTRSELEHAFLRLCRRNRLPDPVVNAPIGPFAVDFLWPEQHLIVETDGYRFHRGRQAFEDDRARDVQLRLLGYEVVRFTHRQIANDTVRVVAALSALLLEMPRDSRPS